MRNILTIMKKELKRFFGDKRMLLSLILPGIVIFICYTLMGGLLSKSLDPEVDYQVAVVNKPTEFSIAIADCNIEFKDYEEKDIEQLKEDVHEERIHLLMVYEKDFESKLASNEKPNLEIYYNSTSIASGEIYNLIYSHLMNDATTVEFKYMINMSGGTYDLATEEEASAMMVSMIFPMVLMILLFSGCMSVTTESIAGEKERGTIATLLVTPTKRSHIALGKILALSITCFVSALSSFIGLLLSLPKLMGSEIEFNLGMYGFGTYLGVFAILVISILMFVVILSIASTFAKSVKEASQYALPVMILVLLISMCSMLNMGKISTNPLLYLIPIYNSTQCLGGFFAMQFNPLCFAITIISNIVYVAIGVYVLTRMFNSEKIMFNK